MKNKRYKRLAKKIIGECKRRECDDMCFDGCPYSDFCFNVVNALDINYPFRIHKTDLEEILKGHNKKGCFINE